MNDWTFFEHQFPVLMESLKHAAKTGRLGHSHLVVTANPDYRLDFPPLLAALEACTSPREDGAPCGQCATCRKILDGTYSDLFTLSPTSKAREITIGKDDGDPDTLRSFEALFHLSSITESGWKIGVVQEADTMNESAQNAFLKTLEEPPSKCMFILTTGRAASLLPTIRSRCQIIALTDNRCTYDLARFAALPELLMKMQFAARGSIAAAEECAVGLIRMLDSLETDADESVRKKWEPRMQQAENLESAGIKLLERRMAGETGCEYRRLREQFISLIHTWFAQIAILAAGTDEALLPNPEIMTPYLNASPRPALKPREAFRLLDAADELVKVLRTNVSDELAIRSFVMTACLSA